jgi:hypothetical protein
VLAKLADHVKALRAGLTESPDIRSSEEYLRLTCDIDARKAIPASEIQRVLKPAADSGCSVTFIGKDDAKDFEAKILFDDSNPGPAVLTADNTIQRPTAWGHWKMKSGVVITAYLMAHVFHQTLISVSQLDVLGYTMVFREGYGAAWSNDDIKITTRGDPAFVTVLNEHGLYELDKTAGHGFEYNTCVRASRVVTEKPDVDKKEILLDGWVEIDEANNPRALSASFLSEVFLTPDSHTDTNDFFDADDSAFLFDAKAKQQPERAMMSKYETERLWHDRYGHFSSQMMDLLRKSGAVEGVNIGNMIKAIVQCETCGADSRRKNFKRSKSRARYNGEMIHVDMIGHIRADKDGYRYILVITDDRSRRITAYKCKTKGADEWFPLLRQYCDWSATQLFGLTVSLIRLTSTPGL